MDGPCLVYGTLRFGRAGLLSTCLATKRAFPFLGAMARCALTSFMARLGMACHNGDPQCGQSREYKCESNLSRGSCCNACYAQPLTPRRFPPTAVRLTSHIVVAGLGAKGTPQKLMCTQTPTHVFKLARDCFRTHTAICTFCDVSWIKCRHFTATTLRTTSCPIIIQPLSKKKHLINVELQGSL